MRRYLVIVEKSENSYSAYTPDLPGCVGAGHTVEEAEEAVHDALQMHLQGLESDNQPIPKTASLAEYLIVNDK